MIAQKTNPYTPGAGFMPAYLAGREALLDQAELSISGLRERYPQRSVMYYGLRGVGKTVLLNAVEEIANDLNVLHDYIEVADKRDFVQQLINAAHKFIKQMLSHKEAAQELAQKALAVLKGFSVTYNAGDTTIEFGLGDDFFLGAGSLSDDLTDVFVALGRAAAKSDIAIVFCIDEAQYMKKEELEALGQALHRVNQLRLPIMFFVAGLPKIVAMLGEAKTYTERLFHFVRIDTLEPEAAQEAIVKPAQRLGVTYTDEAVTKIIETSQGYPYFIQAFCSVLWERENAERIDLSAAEAAEPVFLEQLDRGFFKMRFDRCTKKECAFMFAMVKCGELPCTIANVAHIMGKTVKSVSPYRAQLINKGMIYAVGFGEIDFTVPQFDRYLLRINPELVLS